MSGLFWDAGIAARGTDDGPPGRAIITHAAQRHQRVYARLRRAISAFTRVFDAPSARLRASSTRYDLRRGALLNPGSIVPALR
jgi:hypothetical protein